MSEDMNTNQFIAFLSGSDSTDSIQNPQNTNDDVEQSFNDRNSPLTSEELLPLNNYAAFRSVTESLPRNDIGSQDSFDSETLNTQPFTNATNSVDIPT